MSNAHPVTRYLFWLFFFILLFSQNRYICILWNMKNRHIYTYQMVGIKSGTPNTLLYSYNENKKKKKNDKNMYENIKNEKNKNKSYNNYY